MIITKNNQEGMNQLINNDLYDYSSIIDDDEENPETFSEEEKQMKNSSDIMNDKANEPKKKTKEKKIRSNSIQPVFLKTSFWEDPRVLEIGVDEAGRGPLFGRVYTAAVILPKDSRFFDHSLMKDSKRFHSKKKIQEVAQYIKQNAIAWSVTYEDEKTIDQINILQATQKSMHKSIDQLLGKKEDIKLKMIRIASTYGNMVIPDSFHLLIDGNYFNALTFYNKDSKKIETVPHTCIEGGDNQYSAIAAASILAKVERDQYIEDLCEENPELAEKYGIDTNKGYGAKKHMDGIRQHGITKWHRKTFGICSTF
jgi:ribonuclease HII